MTVRVWSCGGPQLGLRDPAELPDDQRQHVAPVDMERLLGIAPDTPDELKERLSWFVAPGTHALKGAVVSPTCSYRKPPMRLLSR